MPLREDLTFHVATEPRATFFEQVGNIVGMIALETLHHGSEDLPGDERLRIDAVSRVNDLVPKPAKHGH